MKGLNLEWLIVTKKLG